MFSPGKSGVLCAVAMLLAGAAVALHAAARAADEPKPYTVENGRVDGHTFHGYVLFTKYCQMCHAPGGVGSSYPFMPSLVEMLKTVDETQFKKTVINGRQCGEPLTMPAFGDEPDVMLRLNDVYAYLKARSDGLIGPGRPKRIGADHD